MHPGVHVHWAGFPSWRLGKPPNSASCGVNPWGSKRWSGADGHCTPHPWDVTGGVHGIKGLRKNRTTPDGCLNNGPLLVDLLSGDGKCMG